MTTALAAPFSLTMLRRFKPVTAVGRKATYRTSKEDYITRFYRLLRRWKIETAYVSSSSKLFSNLAYREIVAMGEVAIPLIIQELRWSPSYILAALVEITGENPITDEERGDLYAMADAWIAWYEQSGR